MADGTAENYWQLHFDANGATTGQDAQVVLQQITGDKPSDLFVFSHGWNNDLAAAEDLYAAMFPLIAAVPTTPSGARYLGVFWPSIWFPDPPPDQHAAVAAATSAGHPGAADAALSGSDIAAALAPQLPEAAGSLTAMGALVDQGLAGYQNGSVQDSAQAAAVEQFHGLLQQAFPAAVSATEDSGEDSLLSATDPVSAYRAMAKATGSAPTSGDVEGIGDVFGAVWNGAKDALRSASYYEMKARAGTVGVKGLGPFLEQLHREAPSVRVHLIGHSFGARLVSYALSGIPDPDASPVCSLTLVQGAFSHWAFTPAESNPFGDAGALLGMSDRVHGPMSATFSSADWAVGKWYPKASFLAQQDNQDEATAGRWDGMGHDGFQQVSPSGDLSLPIPDGTTLQAGTFYRVDGNAVIADTAQSSFAGAHSDIRHPEVARLIALAAAAG